MIAADLEAAFDAARAAGRTTEPPGLQQNPEPQDVGIVALSVMMREELGADVTGGVSVPGHRCDRCQVAWSGPAPCWVCGQTVPLVIGSRSLWVAR